MSTASSQCTIEDLIEAGMCVVPTELPSLPLNQKRKLPNVPAVYFVLGEDDEVLYIGQSVSLYGRWASHDKIPALQSIENVRLAWIEIDREEEGILGEVERVLINHYSPRLNSRGGRGGKRSNPDYRGTTFFLQKNTLLDANRLVLGSNMDLSDLLESLLQEWVAKHSAGRQ